MGEPKRRPGRPATGVTPVRSVRVGSVWDDAATAAERRGEKIRDVIERALREYVMTAYTVEIQASNATGDIWQALAPAETVADPTADSIEQFAQDVAVNQNIAEGDNWRVCVWQGADADTGTEPDYILDGESPERVNSMGVTADEG